MKNLFQSRTLTLWPMLAVLAIGALVAAACGGDSESEESTPEQTATIQITGEVESPQAGEASPTDDAETEGEISFDAASATITVDGDNSDWSSIEGVTVSMEQIDLDELDPVQVEDMEIEFDPLDPIDVVLKVATDADNIYLLLEVPDDYNFNPEDHNFSPAIAVQFLIDPEAAVHMGVKEEDLETSLGVVDMWHWELDCGPGDPSGGGGIVGGDDPDCNLDDEYAPNPEDREDDGEGDEANPDAENSLAGVWEHTASAEGANAAGTWIFEMSRPLQTGDSQDAQFASGGTATLALAYWDPDETLEGWTDAGHLTSSEVGWIMVILP
ncbi:MAG: ethylbenzene dehydrogenase-related protein [Dehalococcoidia bacterium]